MNSNCHYYLDLINKMPIPQLHKDIIVGCGLGDASFSMKTDGKASIGFDQGLPNKDYLFYLFEIMKEYTTLSRVGERVAFEARYPKENLSYNFRTKVSATFYPFASLFLDKTEKTGKYVKIVPPCIEELLTPGALAFWLQDDGQDVKRGGITLCRDNYIKNEVQHLKSLLENKYKLQCTIHNKNIEKGFYRIYI